MDEIYYQPLLSLVFGLIVIFVIKGRGERKRKILSNCKEVTGTVVDQKENYSRGSGNMSSVIYYPIIRFATEDELLIREEYSEGSNPIKYANGQQVTIQYFVDDPKEFLIKGDDTRLINMVFVLIGVALILYSGFLFFNIFFT
nr:DUF3592 domain-containing protein [uncultured Mucilaginibacter sp.]